MAYIWRAIKAFSPMAPLLFRNQVKTVQDISEEQIETTINKIFLTQQISEFSDLKVFAFDAEILGKEVTAHLDTTLGRHKTGRFNDGQICLQVLQSVRGHRVFIIKSFQNKNINDGIMELLLAVSCMKKAGAASVSAIIPYLPYSSIPEVNVDADFHTVFAADLIKMLQQMGCDQIVTLNCPISHPKGFAPNAALINIYTPEIVIPYLIHTDIKNPVIVGTEANKVHMRNVNKLRKSMSIFDFKCDMGFFNKNDYIGADVRGRDVLLFNNLVRSGNSLKNNSIDLKKKGARNIYCFGFHGLCHNQLGDKLVEELPIKQLIMTNSIFHAEESKKIHTISIAKLLAQLIAIMYEDKSLREYRQEREMMNYAYLQKIKAANKHHNLNTQENPTTANTSKHSKISDL